MVSSLRFGWLSPSVVVQNHVGAAEWTFQTNEKKYDDLRDTGRSYNKNEPTIVYVTQHPTSTAYSDRINSSFEFGIAPKNADGSLQKPELMFQLFTDAYKRFRGDSYDRMKYKALIINFLTYQLIQKFNLRDANTTIEQDINNMQKAWQVLA